MSFKISELRESWFVIKKKDFMLFKTINVTKQLKFDHWAKFFL